MSDKTYVILSQKVLLPELELKWFERGKNYFTFYVCKSSKSEVCPRCASLSTSIYDRRRVKVKDEPIRDKYIYLEINKRRFWCSECKKPFTEPEIGRAHV